MFGLCDCNNFYASCERVFKPTLNGRPIVILSNNDGCVVARSNEAKKLGIRMGAPAFEIKDLLEQNDVQVFSSNYTLYGDMSSRVMNLLFEQAPEVEVYSIDEAFLNLTGIKDLYGYGHHLAEYVTRSTGIPVSLGIAPTKTLAKVANKFAKKYKCYNQVCIIDSEEKRIKALKLTQIEDVWGIGRRLAIRLRGKGVENAYDFTRLPRQWVRKTMTVTGERMWRELQGEPCIQLELVPPDKKQICTSCSFGEMVTDKAQLASAVSTHASTCAKKLRDAHLCAASMMVFYHTNRFRPDLKQISMAPHMMLPVPTQDTLEIVGCAMQMLDRTYREGYHYKKAGVIITQTVPETSVQQNLFDKVDRERSKKLMAALDKVNGLYQNPKVRLAVEGQGRQWRLKREMLSPRYTTCLDDIIVIKAE